MTELTLHRPQHDEFQAIVLPEPRVPIHIRPALESDLSFVDGLQREHSRMVGWLPTKILETNITRGNVLIAEAFGQPVGYCIAQDRYFKRDDCGIVYQLNVTPGKQRGLIGATLIKHVFDRAAYGCKLFCCWCAQDLEANHFWESLGFVPLAFRTGSRKAGQKKEPRIHIFWQRRIREGDTETPYWFPSQTSGGAIREDRLVLPIPPGTHWSDAKPAVLPGMENVNMLPAAPKEKKPRQKQPKPVPPPAPSGGLWFAPPPPPKPEKTKEPKKRFKNDPKLVAAARELRDRYTDQINAGLLLPPSACGKYDVSRALAEASSAIPVKECRLLDAA